MCLRVRARVRVRLRARVRELLYACMIIILYMRAQYVRMCVGTRMRANEGAHARERLHVRAGGVCVCLRVRVRACAREAEHDAAHV